MTDLVNILNIKADGFCDFALTMFIQSGILIVLLYAIDLIIRKHVRAVFRYCIWMLVFIKLVLPVSLSSPVSMGQLFGDKLAINKTQNPIISDVPVKVTAKEADAIVADYGLEHLPPAPMILGQPVRTQVPTITNDSTYMPPIKPSELNAPAAPNIPITWQAVVFLIWLVGVLVLSVLLQRFLFVKILLAQSDIANGKMHQTLDRCRQQVGVRKKIELRLSKSMLSPAVCGLSKPIILMPAALLDDLSEEKLRAVLIHELSHIKRGDLWVNFMQTILQIIYFYNPLLWLANSIVRGIREKAVDEMVLTKLGDQAKSYSNTLIDIAEIAFSRPHFSLRLVGVVESKKALTSRIKHILTRPIPKSTKLGLLSMATIIITAAVLLPMAKGQFNRKVPVLTKKLALPYSVWMADITADDKMKILDFASGDIVELSGFKKEGDFFNEVNSMAEGDVYVCYKEKLNKPMLTFFKGAGLGGKPATNEYSSLSPIPMEIPWMTTVRTRQGCKYRFILKSFDNNQCIIEYKPLNRAAKKAMAKANPETPEFVTDAETGQPDNKFKAILSNGITVELVGICKYPSQDKQWWSPDGTPLGFTVNTIDHSRYTSDYPGYELVFRKSGNASFKIKGIKGCKQYSSLSIIEPEGLTGWRAHIKQRYKKTNIEIASPSGKWKTIVKSTGSSSVTGKDSGKTIVLAAAEQAGKDVIISCSNIETYKNATRIIAVDSKGKELKGKTKTDTGVDGLRQRTVRFVNVDLSDIAKYKFQACPYEYYTFKNVALRPDKNWTYDLPGPDSLAFGSKRARIVDARGNAVAGAIIEFNNVVKVKDVHGNAVTLYPLHADPVITDSKGRFPMPALDTINYAHGKEITFNATVTSDGFMKRRVSFMMSGDFPKEGQIDLARPSVIKGTLLDPAGKPLANAPLIMETQMAYKTPSHGFADHIKSSTDKKGRFSIADVPPGVHLLSYPGIYGDSKHFDLPVADICGAVRLTLEDGQNLDNVVLDLARSTCVVKGRIIDEKGLPIAGVTANIIVELKIIQENGVTISVHVPFYSSKPTEANGTYALNIPPGQWSMNASYPYVKGQKETASSNKKIHLSSGQTKHQDITLKRQDISISKPNMKVEDTEEEIQNLELLTKNSKFTATLDNGVNVELLGVCEHPSQGKQWWTPDGDLLKESPYDDEPFGRAFPKFAERGYKFAVKLSGMAYKGVEFMVIPAEFIQTQRDNVTKKNGKENTKYVEDWIDEKVVGIGASFVEEAESCDIEVGVCFGDWKSKYKYEDDKPNDAVEWVKFENVSLLPNFDQYAGLSEKEQIIRYAESQARLLNHEYIGTEHILLGLIVKNTAAVSQTLKDSGITGRQVYDEILRLVKRSNRVVFKKNLPMTDRAKLALKNATQLAKESNSDTVNSQHVLLGLLQVEDSVGAQVLMNLGLNLEKVTDFASTPEKTAEQSEFKATLANGVTVELESVSRYPINGTLGWTPDGHLLQAPVKTTTTVQSVHPIQTDEQAVLFKLKYYNNDGLVKFKPTIANNSYLFWHEPKSLILTKLPKSQTDSDLKLRVAAGHWKTVAAGGDGDTEAYTNNSLTDTDVIFYPIEKKKGTITIRIANQLGDIADCRAVLYDKAKNMHEPTYWANHGGDVFSCKSTFDTPQEEIAYFALQVRPYETITFKNISLLPNVKTDVEVENQPTDRTFYFKLPLAQPRFHWKFTDKALYLSGRLVLRIIRDDQANEIVVFDNGKITEGWEVMCSDRGPQDNAVYFGFQSTTKYSTMPSDKVELELIAKDDLDGIGRLQTGILKAGTHKAEGKLKIYAHSDKARAYIEWQDKWLLDITSEKGWMNSEISFFINDNGTMRPLTQAEKKRIYSSVKTRRFFGNSDISFMENVATKNDNENHFRKIRTRIGVTKTRIDIIEFADDRQEQVQSKTTLVSKNDSTGRHMQRFEHSRKKVFVEDADFNSDHDIFKFGRIDPKIATKIRVLCVLYENDNQAEQFKTATAFSDAAEVDQFQLINLKDNSIVYAFELNKMDWGLCRKIQWYNKGSDTLSKSIEYGNFNRPVEFKTLADPGDSGYLLPYKTVRRFFDNDGNEEKSETLEIFDASMASSRRKYDYDVIRQNYGNDFDIEIPDDYTIIDKRKTSKNVSLRPGFKTDVEKDVKQINSKLEFRIIPQSPISSYVARSETVNLELEQVKQYKDQLEENGPKTDSDDQFIWLAIKGNTRFNSSGIPVYADYNGNKYVFACNTAPAAMKADGSWGLKNVYVKDENGRPVITVEFDESGAKLINRLTTDYLGNPLAIVIDGKVITAPTVMSALSDKVKITGNFTQEKAEDIAEGLKKGMPKTVVPVAGVDLPVRFITSDNDGKVERYHWRLNLTKAVRLSRNSFKIEGDSIRGYWGSTDGTLTSPEDGTNVDYQLIISKDGEKLDYLMRESQSHEGLDGYDDIASSYRKEITQPECDQIRTYILKEPVGLSEKYLPMWKRDFIKDGKVIDTLLYAVRIVGEKEADPFVPTIKDITDNTDDMFEMKTPAVQVEKIIGIKEVYLPNFDGDKHQILDLKSGELIDFPKIDDDFELFAAVVNGETGEIVYDRSEGRLRIAWLQVSTTDGVISIADRFGLFWADPDALPMSQTITTREGERYKVQFVKADENGCTVKFYPLPGNKTARMDKANAGVEGEAKSASR